MIINQNPHILQSFDAELEKLNQILIIMIDFIAIELDQTIKALERNDIQSLENSIELIKKVESAEQLIDLEVLSIIARFTPVANDLRNVFVCSKIAAQFEKISNELSDFMCLLISLNREKNNPLNSELLGVINETSVYIVSLINKLSILLFTKEIDRVYIMIEESKVAEIELNNKLQNYLLDLNKNIDHVDTINIVTAVIQLLQFCPSQIRRIGGYIITSVLSDNQFREKWISDAAYFIAETRGFTPGSEINDWLRAENEFERYKNLNYFL